MKVSGPVEGGDIEWGDVCFGDVLVTFLLTLNSSLKSFPQEGKEGKAYSKA